MLGYPKKRDALFRGRPFCHLAHKDRLVQPVVGKKKEPSEIDLGPAGLKYDERTGLRRYKGGD